IFGHLPQPRKPLSYLAIDFTGPYGDTRYPYAVTISDMYTRLFRVYPTEHPTTDSVCKALEDWKISYGQYPELLMHDNDKAFSDRFAQWCADRCIQEARTAIYSPESNSAAERPHRTFHDGIRACLYSSGEKDWTLHADSVVYRMNATKNSTTGESPYSMLLNIIPRCPFFQSHMSNNSSSFSTEHVCLFPVGTVVARRVEQPLKLAPRYEGSYEVLAEVRPGTFRIQRLGATSPPIDVKQDRLKAYPTSDLIQHF
ncbi:gag/pol/env polyprotein, putative, partial [Perkinsus marinus ATCC 50983]